MIKCEVIQDFLLKDFDKIKNIVRGGFKDKYGELYVTDVFECDEEMADYLTGNNKLNKTVVKILEVKPEKEVKEETTKETKTTTKAKKTKKKTSKK